MDRKGLSYDNFCESCGFLLRRKDKNTSDFFTFGRYMVAYNCPKCGKRKSYFSDCKPPKPGKGRHFKSKIKKVKRPSIKTILQIKEMSK